MSNARKGVILATEPHRPSPLLCSPILSLLNESRPKSGLEPTPAPLDLQPLLLIEEGSDVVVCEFFVEG